MRGRDPLLDWLFIYDLELPARSASEYRRSLKVKLDEFEAHLANQSGKVNYGKINFGELRWPVPVAVPKKEIAQAQTLYRTVYNLGGTMVTYAQEILLNLIALAQDPDSVAFWLEILYYKKPRDSFRQERYITALSALALLAILKDLPTAYQGLRSIVKEHPDGTVRGLALHYLYRIYSYNARPLPKELITDIHSIAAIDPAFEPRFHARRLLLEHDIPFTADNPGGTYTFKVKFMHNKRIYRTIELLSGHTLEDLHFAIQRAIGWDSDHLYSFFMNGELFDDRYSFSCPYEEDRPPWTGDAFLGELGLVLGHKFLYYFDYGDSHKFEVEVVDINPQADKGKYPRIVKASGEAPDQYGW
jgi:hypothetical protein